MNTYDFYLELTKPFWSPPAWIFGPVWTILYIIIAITFGTVFYKAITKKIKQSVVAPFILNLIFNFIFTPILFGLQNIPLASIDILLVLSTLLWAMVVIWKKYPKLRWIAYANIPYLLWVLFATCLQLTILYLNW